MARPKTRILLISEDAALAYAINLNVRWRAERVEVSDRLGVRLDLAKEIASFDPRIVILDARLGEAYHDLNRRMADARTSEGHGIVCLVVARDIPAGWPPESWVCSRFGYVAQAILEIIKQRAPLKRGPKSHAGPSVQVTLEAVAG